MENKTIKAVNAFEKLMIQVQYFLNLMLNTCLRLCGIMSVNFVVKQNWRSGDKIPYKEAQIINLAPKILAGFIIDHNKGIARESDRLVNCLFDIKQVLKITSLKKDNLKVSTFKLFTSPQETSSKNSQNM